MFAKLLQQIIHAGNGYALKTVAPLFLDESQQTYWGFGLKIAEEYRKFKMAALRLHLSGVLINQKVTSKLKSRDLLLSRKNPPTSEW